MMRSVSYTWPSAAGTSDEEVPFSVMYISFTFQSFATWCGPQYNTSGPMNSHGEAMCGYDGGFGTMAKPLGDASARTNVGWEMLVPTKSIGVEIVLRSSAVMCGASAPMRATYASVYLPSMMTVRYWAFISR